MLQRTFNFRGGEAEGLKRLHHYLWGSDAVAGYFNTRNGGWLFNVLLRALGQVLLQLSVPDDTRSAILVCATRQV
jgi:hypothetical protein